jgi:ribosome-associated toxin RatA of RatAB toxin-antitoxin module
MKNIAITMALFVSLICVSIPFQSSALDFSKRDLERLTAGKLIKKRLPNSCQNGFYGGTGFSVVNAPVDVVWKMLQDWSAYPDAFPRTVEAKVLSRNGNKALVRMRLGYKLLSVKYHVNVIANDENKTLSFTLVNNRPHDIESTRGYWKLVPQDGGRTLVIYAVAVQLPAGIVNFLGDSLEKSLERNLIGLPAYVKEYVESPAGNQYRRMTAKK